MPMTRHRQQGMSLIELMVSIVIGMIIMAGVLGLSIATFGANATQIRAAKLQYELRKVVDDFARDLRRAGYRPLPAGSTVPLPMPLPMDVGSQNVPTPLVEYAGARKGNSMQLQYDIDDTPSADDDERQIFEYIFGINNDGVGQVFLRINGGAPAPLTDTKVVDITEFQVMKGVLMSGVEDPAGDSSYAPGCATGVTNSVAGNVYSVRVTGRLVNDINIKRTVVETITPRNLLVTACSP